MRPWIILKPAFTVVGIPLDDVDFQGDVDGLWDQLASRYAEIPDVDPDQGFGVHPLTRQGHTYLVGLIVRKIGLIPDGMAAKQILPKSYAVFLHNGLSAYLEQTVKMIFRDWLPSSGYQQAGNFYFEYYDDRFHPGSPESVIFLYLPVRQRRD